MSKNGHQIILKRSIDYLLQFSNVIYDGHQFIFVKYTTRTSMLCVADNIADALSVYF